MDYLLCIPARERNTRENCEKIHNVLARMSDTYKLRIVPEPVKNKQFPCPPYYKKYRIYKPVKERDTNGEAYLEKEEEEMILSSCKTEEEQELMKSCIYAYQYSASIVLKSFREKEKKNKMQVRPLSERTQAAKGAGAPTRGGRPGTPEKSEKPEQERGTQERLTGSDRPYRNRTAERNTAEGGSERPAVRERDRSARVSGAERMADRRGGNRTVPENEKNETRSSSGRRERFERRSSRRGERSEIESNESVRTEIANLELPKSPEMPKEITGTVRAAAEAPKTVQQRADMQKPESQNPEAAPLARSNDAPVQGNLPFRAGVETGSLPPFRSNTLTAAQPMQRKSEGYAPMERKSVQQPQTPDSQI